MISKAPHMTGGCNCGAVRYSLLAAPVFTHICHCRQCQRSSGGAFNVSTVVFQEDFRFDDGEPDIHYMSGPTGTRYEVWTCDKCGCTLGGKSTEPEKLMVIRPGSLDDTTKIDPQAHIWTSEKQAWVEIPAHLPAFEKNYDPEKLWPKHCLERLNRD